MDAVVTIRIPKQTRLKMRKYKGNWSAEVRSYIESRINALELAELLDRLEKQRRHMRRTSDSVALIREDRDSR